jgi:repressor LexA
MKKEDYVKMLIASAGHTAKSFAESIDLPYTTLLGMLTRGLGGASVHNVIKVCRGLSISVEDLQRADSGEDVPLPFYATDREKRVIEQYRKKPEMKPAIDALLGIEPDK